jgi:hypothetical protein
MNVWGLTKKVLGVGLLCLPLTMSTTLTGCLTDEEGDDTTTTPTDTTKALTTKSIELGAQSNTKPSSLDLDTWTAYSATDGATKSADIDIVFAFSTSADIAALYSPNIAKNGVAGSSGGFDFMASWPNANTTLMRKVTVANIDNVKSQADIKALYDAGSDPSPVGRIEATAGSYIVALSDDGKYVLIKVDTVTAAANGETKLSGWAAW